MILCCTISRALWTASCNGPFLYGVDINLIGLCGVWVFRLLVSIAYTQKGPTAIWFHFPCKAIDFASMSSYAIPVYLGQTNGHHCVFRCLFEGPSASTFFLPALNQHIIRIPALSVPGATRTLAQKDVRRLFAYYICAQFFRLYVTGT